MTMDNQAELVNKLSDQVPQMLEDINNLTKKLDDLERKAKETQALCNELKQGQPKRQKGGVKISFAPLDSGLKFQELVFSNVSEAESALGSSRGSIGKRLAGKIKSLSFNATYKGKEGIAVVKVTPHIELP